VDVNQIQSFSISENFSNKMNDFKKICSERGIDQKVKTAAKAVLSLVILGGIGIGLSQRTSHSNAIVPKNLPVNSLNAFAFQECVNPYSLPAPQDNLNSYIPSNSCPEPAVLFSYQLQAGNFASPNETELETLYGNGRIRSDEEGRALYNLFAEANRKAGLAALDSTKFSPKEVAETASKIRHHMRLYIRETGPEKSQKIAEYIDFVRYGNIHGQTLKQIFGKHMDPRTIIIKAGSTNQQVNTAFNLLNDLPAWLQKPIIWSAVKLKLL